MNEGAGANLLAEAEQMLGMYIYKGNNSSFLLDKLFAMMVQPVFGFQPAVHLRTGNGDAGADLRAQVAQMLGSFFYVFLTSCLP